VLKAGQFEGEQQSGVSKYMVNKAHALKKKQKF
jgi:hypothetical protein